MTSEPWYPIPPDELALLWDETTETEQEPPEPTPRQPTPRFDAGENAMMRGIAAADQHDLQTGLK